MLLFINMIIGVVCIILFGFIVWSLFSEFIREYSQYSVRDWVARFRQKPYFIGKVYYKRHLQRWSAEVNYYEPYNSKYEPIHRVYYSDYITSYEEGVEWVNNFGSFLRQCEEYNDAVELKDREDPLNRVYETSKIFAKKGD